MAAWAALICWAAGATAGDADLRVRIEWGGGAQRQWEGSVRVSEGSLSEPRLLGVEADEAGSMWLEEGHVEIRQPSPRVYDGLDLTVTAPLEAKLIVDLAPREEPGPPASVEIPLVELVTRYHNSRLDQRNNRLWARRAPGDRLRVELAHDALVFAPGQLLELEVRPHLLGLAPGTKLRLRAQLRPARTTHEFWSREEELTLGDNDSAAVPLAVKLPLEEGVYDLLLTASRRGLPNRLGWKQALDERKVQVVVLSDQPARPPEAPGASPPQDQLLEIDPASPAWWERIANVAWIPGLRKGPLGNGEATPWRHPAGPMIELGAAGREPDIHWQAYPTAIGSPGQPHVLEVEYPADVPQTLGISLVEPNAAGALMPIGLDSGVYLAAEASNAAPRVARHRLIFWPRTKTPIVLVTNRRDGSRAVYGKIRVLGPRPAPITQLGREPGRTYLPRAFPAEGSRPERLLAGYYDRPLFSENFSATEDLDAWSGRSLDDWRTFYEGATRLVEYLHHVGYNGLLLSVLADGSTIYPSAWVESTPRYDTGVFFATGQDPVRKDVLELVFRLFDREGLRLIPALQFSMPLPQLEAIKRRGGPASAGIELVGADGSTWLARNPPRRGLAPYYNPLNERVQEAMLAVVRELADRYRHHPSFAGVALQLSADGYAELPGADWGYDDDTLARYQRDMNVALPDAGPEVLARRVELLRGEQRATWLAWRAQTLTLFHRRLQAEAAQGRPGVKLYLAGAGMFSRPELERELRPALPRATTHQNLLRSVGIDPALYRDLEQIVFLRPQRIAPLNSLSAQAVNLELNQDPSLDRSFAAQANSGSLFFHEPQEARLASFDAQSPFKRSYAWLVAQPSPSGRENRRRFIHALATLDARAMFDGGWLLPLGQEEELRDLVAVYRELPDAAFETIYRELPGGRSDEPPAQAQPVTIRTLARRDRTYLYLVNDSPWRATVTLAVQAPAGCRLEGLGAPRLLPALAGSGPARTWTVELEPYGLVGASLAGAGIRVSDPRVSLPDEVSSRLDSRIRDLWARSAVLRDPPAWDVLANRGFEQPAERGGGILGWDAGNQAAAEVQLDDARPHAGRRSLKLSSRGGAAWLASGVFAAPPSGRVSLSVMLRVADAGRQPPLRVALEGKVAGQDYYRFASVGQGPDVDRIGTLWGQYVFRFLDLPPEGLSSLRVRFDLLGPGDVWIDDIELRDLDFDSDERLALSKIISSAELELKRSDVGDCLRLLEGYWPRLLASNVALAQDPVAQNQRPKTGDPASPQPPSADDSSVLDRFKRALGLFR